MTTIIRNPLGLSGEGPQVVGQQRPALESVGHLADLTTEQSQFNPFLNFGHPLIWAVNVNDVGLVIKALQNIAAGMPTEPSLMGMALYLAITKGCSECVEAILNHDSRLLEKYLPLVPSQLPGSKLEYNKYIGLMYIDIGTLGTPLVVALLYNRFDIAKSLIDKGASVNKTTIGTIKEIKGFNPIDVVFSNSFKNDKDSKYPDMIKYLCNHGAVPSTEMQILRMESPEFFDTPTGKAIQECERVTVNPLEGLQGSEAGQQASFLNPFRPQEEVLNPFRKIGGRRTRRRASRRKLRPKTTYRKMRKTRQRSR